MVPARKRANGNFSDASLERLHSVRIIATRRPVCFTKFFWSLYKFYFLWTVCEICDEREWHC